MVKILKLLLYPFAVLYDLVTRVRNHFFDIGQKPSFEFDTTVIIVGNLNVGGSGKTPMIEYLLRLLKDQFKLATLSRGYKRDTAGYKLATISDSARTLGDEPYQLFRKFGSQVNVVVGEDRVFAIPNILQEFSETDIILLDDAFQHRAVKPKLSILVTEYIRPFSQDFLMPYGRLREARKGALRADVIVVTKCDENITAAQKSVLRHEIELYAPGKPVFFSSIRYMTPEPAGSATIVNKNIVLVSGIAGSKYLEDYCRSHFNVLKHFDFPDHHRYTSGELGDVRLFCEKQTVPISIITTEKDIVKLLSKELKPLLDQMPWFFLPIEQYFLEDGLKFDELIFRSVKNQ